jgi:hypothetical protein
VIRIAVPILCAIVFAYSYLTSDVARTLHNLPPKVAKPLKKALYFSNIQKDPQNALKFYKEALFAAQEEGLHPLSDTVIGITCQIALYFASIHHHPNAIEVLEKMRKSLLEWLETDGEKHMDDGERARILKRAVGQSVQLGEWYSLDWIGRFDDAEEALVLAADMVLGEQERLKSLGQKEDEKFPLSDEEVGGALEGMKMMDCGIADMSRSFGRALCSPAEPGAGSPLVSAGALVVRPKVLPRRGS